MAGKRYRVHAVTSEAAGSGKRGGEAEVPEMAGVEE
jgi:hypothetical protein